MFEKDVFRIGLFQTIHPSYTINVCISTPMSTFLNELYAKRQYAIYIYIYIYIIMYIYIIVYIFS